MRKYLDGIKTKPKTELEAHKRWMNRLQSNLATLNRYRTRIPVIEVDEQQENMRVWHNQAMILRYGRNWYRDQENDNE